MMAPSYANIFMDSLERQFLESEPLQMALWKRYIEDILRVSSGSRAEASNLASWYIK